MRIFVGSIPFSATEEDLHDFFSNLGLTPERVEFVMDRELDRPRGFGFVDFRDKTTGEAAIEAANGVEFMGRTLNVNEAKPRGSSTPQRSRGQR